MRVFVSDVSVYILCNACRVQTWNVRVVMVNDYGRGCLKIGHSVAVGASTAGAAAQKTVPLAAWRGGTLQRPWCCEELWDAVGWRRTVSVQCGDGPQLF